MDKINEYSICLLGKRQGIKNSLFIESGQIFADEVMKNGLKIQIRTLGWPSAIGMLDKAIIKVSKQPIRNMEIPKKYDILFLCDQYETKSGIDFSIFLNHDGFFVMNSENESVHIENNLIRIFFNFNKSLPNTRAKVISYTLQKLFNFSCSANEDANWVMETNFTVKEKLKDEIDSFLKEELFDKSFKE